MFVRIYVNNAWEWHYSHVTNIHVVLTLHQCYLTCSVLNATVYM